MRTAGVVEPGATFLPYYCEKLRAGFFKSPCNGKYTEARAYRDKFPHGLLGPLEHCLGCQGKNLIIREASVPHLEGKTDPAGGLQDPAIAPQSKDKLQDFDQATPLGQKEESMESAPSKAGAQAETPAPPDTATTTIKGQFCKNHPAVESHKNKHGRYMGRCRECLAAVAARNRWSRGSKAGKEITTPAVARDLGKVKEVAATKCGLPEVTDYPPMPPVNPPAIPTCKNHPEVPAMIDRVGRNMGLCRECVSERGRKAGIANHSQGLTWPPISIPLNQEKYAEVKAWLEEQALENERILTQEIMYRLKLAMREASLLG